MAKASDYAQCALTDDEAAATGRITKVWENDAWVLWHVDHDGRTASSGRRDSTCQHAACDPPTPDHCRSRPLDDLVALLDLEAIEVNIFRGVSPDENRQRVFGGQVAGQALVAAARTSTTRAVWCTRSTPTSCAPATRPCRSSTRSTASATARASRTRRVVAIQHGKAIFNLQASFHRAEPGLDHQEPMAPDVPDPETLPDFADPHGAPPASCSASGTTGPAPSTPATSTASPTDREGPQPPQQRVWLRADGPLPDDPVLHACVAHLRVRHDPARHHAAPHGISALGGEGLQMASLDHAMWFHRPFRADEWLLYDQWTPSTSDARGLAMGQIFTQDGRLVVTVVQEGLIRVVP